MPVATHVSAIYQGAVRHRRMSPVEHSFRYKVFMMYLDLDELPGLFDNHPGWGVDKRALAAFHRSDYFGPPEVPLMQAVRDAVEEKTGRRPEGPIRMLTNLRYFGYCFNPVTFYYCFDPSGTQVDCILAEITNTPWRERHSYIMQRHEARLVGPSQRFDFPKEFHVSPFIDMDIDYAWRFSPPGERLVVHMDDFRRPAAASPAMPQAVGVQLAGEQVAGRQGTAVQSAGAQVAASAASQDSKVFDATLVLKRKEISTSALTGLLLRHPCITATTLAAIYWQAFRLRLKKCPFYSHPQHDQESHAHVRHCA